MESGYATVQLKQIEDRDDVPVMLTETLGCTDTDVTIYDTERISLPLEQERLCIPVLENGRASLDGVDLPTRAIAFLPAGCEGTIAFDTTTTLIVVSAPAPHRDRDSVILDLDACDFELPPTSSIPTAHLSEALGCEGMKVNARTLDPGQHVPYHREGTQEELFVPVRGPARMCIDGEMVRTPVKSITRVAPPVPRSAVNDGDERALWIMIGAPPTGGPTEWDPGAANVDE